ncbi:UDP:flavonoid glycosyltransferase YjiC (YdhE family) [Kitasatospora sp. MAP12-15]|uniref:glycosyltransferase n=1 Tax=unclassified Kitasatospora TaxID=2633591 RepID=UPI0024743DED|nr:glycosyltransferase [Kitasatospora sp. MAP12-44]MDH6108714.1 UDP:flavonoid glycosyltransferase YjiC (YdhE family) [Kitasatospora sp. MAP12-44]
MRILFTFIGGSGHFRPLIPVARAAQAAGHTVAIAGAGGRGPEIAAAGFTAFATSEPRRRAEAADRRTLEIPDPEADVRQLAEGFARRGARRHAAAVLELARAWKPDVLVRDEVDFGTAIAAESLALPCATVLVLAAGGFLRKEVVAEPLHELRSAYGLPPDPELAMLDRHLVLSPFPPSFRNPRFPLPARTFSFRQTAISPADATPRTPTVYFTLGTVNNTTDLFSKVMAGLRELPVNVVVTVGERVDPAELGPLPDHVRVEQFVPQELLLPQCDLVVSHGGSGSLMGALAHGLPSVLLPLGADQPYNAQRCVELGIAQVLDPVTVTSEEVRMTVSAVLADGAYRRAAERVREEINALPGAEQTIPLLEGLHR